MNDKLMSRDQIKTFIKANDGRFATETAVNFARQLYDVMGENERLHKAVLLAARWFKLNFEDETLNEHPPSKADLAGMFDAMQEARLNPSKTSETK